ncbi:MAG: putative Ig domain-containing protein, partial [candidate division Zixibacteria bacterium]|nr:putative Ig domain-containing protein [candidate division Zixibacteria bacterium]
CDPNPVVVWVSDVTGQQRCPAQITRTYRATDACGNQAICTQTITVQDQTPPTFSTFPADQNIVQCQPTQICLPVAAADNCPGTVVLSVVNGGKGAIVGGQWCVTPTVTESYNVTIRAADTCGNYVDRTFHVAYLLNGAPTFTNCPQDARIHWGQTYTVDLNATDPDAGQTLTYSLCPGAPQGVTLNPTTGELQFASAARDICDPEVCVIVKDDCQATATCSFNVCVYNDPPAFDLCSKDQVICYGYPFADSVHATDPDHGPYLFYYLQSGPSGMTVNVNTGKIEWLSPIPGDFDICVLATDSAKVCDPCSPSNADTCCFELRVVSLDLVIEKKHDQIQGQLTDVSISFMHQGSNWPIAGYDLLIQYDNSAICLQSAKEGKFFTDCAWEYFTYRFGPNGNCGPSACPTGVLRIVALAETTGGNMAVHPDCYTNDGIPNPGPGSSTAKELAILKFLVSNDRTLECQFVPVRFIWYDCGDNSLSNVRGDTLFISNFVYDYAGEVGNPPVAQWNDITGLDNTWPTVTGALRAECDSIHFKSELIQCANFYNGGVDIICADSIDAPGD